jgi:hypothetical protein
MHSTAYRECQLLLIGEGKSNEGLRKKRRQVDDKAKGDRLRRGSNSLLQNELAVPQKVDGKVLLGSCIYVIRIV